MEQDKNLPITERLKAIADSPVKVTFTDEHIVKLDLPYDCSIEGCLDAKDGSKTMTVSSFLRVPKELRGHAIGERLIQGLTVIAKEEGATTLASNISSPYALAIRRRIFGDGALQFVSPEGDLYDITADEAATVLDKMYASEDDQEAPVEGIDVEVDLLQVNTDGWESPLRA